MRKGLLVAACTGLALLLIPIAKFGHDRWRQAWQDAEDAAHHAFLTLQDEVQGPQARAVLQRLQVAELAAELRREEKRRENRRRSRLLRQPAVPVDEAPAPAPEEGALTPDAEMELAPSEEVGLAPSDLAPSDGEDDPDGEDVGEQDGEDDGGDLEASTSHRKKKKHTADDEPSGVAIIRGHRAGDSVTGAAAATSSQTTSRPARGGVGAAGYAGATPSAPAALGATPLPTLCLLQGCSRPPSS
eukprot:jgi/Botrbrau1/1343/Bobra.0063s0054.1